MVHGESSMKLDFREAAPVKVTGFSQKIWQKSTRNIHLIGCLFEALASWVVNLERKQKLLKSKTAAFRIYLSCRRKQLSPVYCTCKKKNDKEGKKEKRRKLSIFSLKKEIKNVSNV